MLYGATITWPSQNMISPRFPSSLSPDKRAQPLYF
jgi:hypothetical protein